MPGPAGPAVTLLTETVRPLCPRSWSRLKVAAALTAIIVAPLGIIGTAKWPFLTNRGLPTHLADAGDRQTIMRGKTVYLEHCASCHGRYLQGQPLWQLTDEYAHRRAPALDQTGRAWLRADEELFLATKFGHSADVMQPGIAKISAFATVLDDTDILAAIAFIKGRWPIGLRVLQAMRNPGQAGMPAGANRTDWTVPPDCQTTASPQLRRVPPT